VSIRHSLVENAENFQEERFSKRDRGSSHVVAIFTYDI
jgi:hypothetical protein